MSTIDEYLDSVSPPQKAALGRVRTIIKMVVPEAEESISYGMPTFKYKGKRLLHFAAFKHHMSLFGGVDAAREKLDKFKLSNKGTLQFTLDNPLPELVIKEILEKRIIEINKKG